MIKRQLSVTEVNRFVKTLIATNSVLKSLEIKGAVSYTHLTLPTKLEV